MDWAWQLEHGKQPPLPGKSHYQYKKDLDREVKEQVTKGIQKNAGISPRVHIIGSLGRCGRGAIECCIQAGLLEENLLQWDLAETKVGGPFVEIRQVRRSTEVFGSILHPIGTRDSNELLSLTLLNNLSGRPIFS